jgi:anthranilate phosphoribosyltransferase
MTATVPWPRLLDRLLQGRDLEEEQATALMHGWLAGEIEPVLTGALLAGLGAKGVSGPELAAMAAVLREASPVPATPTILDASDANAAGSVSNVRSCTV